MTKERFSHRKLAETREGAEKPRGPGNAKGLGEAAALSAILMALAPATASAQTQPDKPNLYHEIALRQQAIQATGDPRYTYDNPQTTARFIGEQCSTSETDLLDSATVRRVGKNKIVIKLRGRDGMAPAAVARRNVVTTEPTLGGFSWNCNISNTDIVTARVMERRKKRHGKFGPWRRHGSSVELLPDSVGYDIVPGDKDVGSGFTLRGVVKAARRLTPAKLRAKRYGLEIKDKTSSPYAPGKKNSDKRVLTLDKRKQTKQITR